MNYYVLELDIGVGLLREANTFILQLELNSYGTLLVLIAGKGDTESEPQFPMHLTMGSGPAVESYYTSSMLVCQFAGTISNAPMKAGASTYSRFFKTK
jgi:hypothetical protein